MAQSYLSLSEDHVNSKIVMNSMGLAFGKSWLRVSKNWQIDDILRVSKHFVCVNLVIITPIRLHPVVDFFS